MYTISRFSRISRLSTKMLRYYDSIGLLKPCKTDPFNNYRYYDSKQIKDIIIINKLKAYDFSLKDIKKVLKDGSNKLTAELMKDRIYNLEDEIRKKQNILETLENEYECLLAGRDIFNKDRTFNISLDIQKPITVLGVRDTVSVENIYTLMNAAFEKVGKYGLKPAGPVITIYYDEDFDPSYADVEVCIPVSQRLKGDASTKDISGGLCVHTVFTGPYNEIAEGYSALCDWMESKGYEPVGSPYEKYINGIGSGCAASDYITEIYFPVRKLDKEVKHENY